MSRVKKSTKLDTVCYDIRGPAMRLAQKMEEEGSQIIKLNIGNPAPFGFSTPVEIVQDMILNLSKAEGYSDSKGIFAARKAIMQYYQVKQVRNVTIDDVFIGNGVSELIMMSIQALVNNGDEILLPTPDYPLWTAVVNLAGGKAVHYICDEQSLWYPDMQDIESKITEKTKAIVVINPNNPTGAVYSRQVLEQIVHLAQKHGLVVLSDEIYDKILYDELQHTCIASLADDVLFLTFNGISKAYRAAGFRAGWLVVSGQKDHAKDYIEGLEILSTMRLCSNVPAQYTIQTALGGYQSVNELVLPTGRLGQQRDFAYEKIIQIPGLSCVKPQGALYLFPRMDIKKFNITDDLRFILDLLIQQKILLVQGTGFNWLEPDHFRIVFLPSVSDLSIALDRMALFLSTYRQQ